ncbi:NAD(P)H-hydrate dehydratase [Rhizobium deserti]|uniref:ADP-dependent (S)-NAD(P)H-hydrate dehydratase n=2 Tax=Rhizobium deserti TaxID=2547961 RepID=A0A4V3ANP3_9HYPH|nr:NAD(P)H-hydrate dehydratase [Rhizobium deserti]TDK32352.1 NAD(P)H-hydrate dehydratase [Rhizobium deserti]
MDTQIIDAALLAGLPLPQPAEGSKEERGRICIIGGSREVPGAVLLAALGAMRAGAGKLQIATVESRAGALALAMPEALVISLPETKVGGLESGPVASTASRWASSNALLVGPGMVEEADGHEVLRCLLDSSCEAAIVVDAGALPRIMELGDSLRRRSGRVIITPHAGEMANLLGVDKEVVEHDPTSAALRLTKEFELVVIMKGSQTVITAPTGIWRYQGGGVGLATSGSGDVLAGIIAGLAARGAEPLIAAIWGVFLHGEAGSQLAKTVGPLGFLAREIPDLVPKLMIEPS